jgi:hypothetical protein
MEAICATHERELIPASEDHQARAAPAAPPPADTRPREPLSRPSMTRNGSPRASAGAQRCDAAAAHRARLCALHGRHHLSVHRSHRRCADRHLQAGALRGAQPHRVPQPQGLLRGQRPGGRQCERAHHLGLHQDANANAYELSALFYRFVALGIALFHFVGDDAYSNGETMLCPIPGASAVGSQQDAFNYYQSLTRQPIERGASAAARSLARPSHLTLTPRRRLSRAPSLWHDRAPVRHPFCNLL